MSTLKVAGSLRGASRDAYLALLFALPFLRAYALSTSFGAILFFTLSAASGSASESGVSHEEESEDEEGSGCSACALVKAENARLRADNEDLRRVIAAAHGPGTSELQTSVAG